MLAEAGLVNLGEVIPGTYQLKVDMLAEAGLINLGEVIPGTYQLDVYRLV
jgi:hypothetical protein